MDDLELEAPLLQSESKEIWVNSFDERAAQKFRDKVLRQAEEDPRRPIVIYIDSYGGAADGLAKMIETLEEIVNPTITVCMGKAMSAGAILLSCGDMRYCGRHSRIMVHEMLGGTGGNVHDMHADAAEVMRLNEHFIGILAKNCGIEDGYEGIRRIFKEHNSREIYLDAQGAKDFGLVDEIGTPALVAVPLYQVLTIPPKAKYPKQVFNQLEALAEETEDAKPVKKKSKMKSSRPKK